MRQPAIRHAAIGGLVGLLLVGGVVGVAVASPTPTPVCPVCGTALHPNVTSSTATLQLSERGDVHWRVENEVAEPTASAWREDETLAREAVLDRLDRPFRRPHHPTDVTVTMTGDTLAVTFVDTRAARQRLGLLVVPYLHGEGVEARYVINADRLTVVAPAGQRIANHPAGATVSGDRATWTGVAAATDRRQLPVRAAPEPGDTYVLTGSGPTASARASLVVAVEPLDARMYAMYAIGAVIALVPTVAVGHRRLGRGHLLAGAGLVLAPVVALAATMHPIHPPNTLPGLADRVFFVLGSILVSLVGVGILLARLPVGGEAAGD